MLKPEKPQTGVFREAVLPEVSVATQKSTGKVIGDRVSVQSRVIVIGGGAGGLELVVKLAKKLRRDKQTEVVLIDKNPTHIWKPLFHEVATGSMNSYHDEASYSMLAKKHGFRFLLGEVVGIDLKNSNVTLAPVRDEYGDEMMPGRLIDYHQLAVAVGSLSNDFGIKGVKEFARQLDSREQAEFFHKQFASQLHKTNSRKDIDSVLSIAIVGGGATGVELAADMHNVVDRLRGYGFDHFSRDRLQVSLIEAAPQLLPRLPDRIGLSVANELRRIGVTVHLSTMVSEVQQDCVLTSDGAKIDADLSVWAAGVKAPSWLKQTGFPTDRLGRIEVNPGLDVKGYPGVFAIGDCCSCYTDEGVEVPPRAQAAHQMASIAARNIRAVRRGKTLKPFKYRDFGSLVSLSKYSTIGNLMGNLVKGTVFVEGWLARLVYLSLYRMHQAAIHGPISMLLIMLGDRIYKATRAEVKLH